MWLKRQRLRTSCVVSTVWLNTNSNPASRGGSRNWKKGRRGPTTTRLPFCCATAPRHSQERGSAFPADAVDAVQAGPPVPPQRRQGRMRTLPLEAAEKNQQLKLLPAEKRGGWPVRAGATWCFARRSFLFSKYSALQSSWRHPDSSYPLKGNMKTTSLLLLHTTEMLLSALYSEGHAPTELSRRCWGRGGARAVTEGIHSL